MSDSPTTTHRCPFCHEGIATDAQDRVTCRACDAAHHAECFLEAVGCATTACKHPEVRIGNVEVPLAMLSHLVANPERFRQVAAMSAPNQGLGAKLLAGFGLIVFCSLMGLAAAGSAESAIPFLAGGLVGAFVGLVLSAGLFVGGGGAQRLHSLDGPSLEFDPIFGMWSTSSFLPGSPPSTPTDELREQLATGAAPVEAPLPPGEPPEACPDCTQPLETDEPTGYCYHCGSALVDVAGRWRVKE